MADVSSNNGAVDLRAYAAAGHAAIAIKASEGTGYVNPGHRAQADEAHRLGLTVVHYHFARPGRGQLHAELANFHRTYLAAWRNGDYVCLDLEVTEGADVAWYARAFLGALKGYGHPTILYTYRAFAGEHLQGVRADRWWIADYSGALSSEHAWAKQYTDGQEGPGPHHYAGIGNCDGSVLNVKTALTLWARKHHLWRR
jgi:GH25 family lysozyme M1 (1,4-beta-N-acetylmuramidase)